MKEHTQKLLDKSLDVLEAAEALLKIGKIDVAAGRAYYSMMHTAEAGGEADEKGEINSLSTSSLFNNWNLVDISSDGRGHTP